MSGADLVFDRDLFANTANNIRVVNLRLSMDHVAAEIGVTKAQLFRAEHRRPINIQAFLRICRWMGIPADSFLLPAPADVPRDVVGATRELAAERT